MSNGNGGGFGFDFGGFFDGLLAVLAEIIQAIIDFLVALVNVLVKILNFLFQGELGIFDFSFKSLDKIYRGLKNILDHVFKVWVTAAIKHLWDLYQKLTAWVRKLKVWLDRLRRIQQLHLLAALRRYLNLIQRIRKILLVFKLLHIGIAKKLDKFLAGLEGRLTTSVFRHIQKTNEIIKWINLVADPRGLLHPGGQLAGIGGILKAVNDAIAELRPGEFNCVPGQQTGPGVAVLPWVTVRTRLERESRAKDGDTAAITAQFNQARDMFALDIGDAAKLRAGG
jgi:hypothetical protein